LLLLVLASITIITLDYRGDLHGAISGAKRVAHDAYAPVGRGVDAILRPVSNFFAGAVHYGSLQTENATLRHELAQTRGQQIQDQALRQQLASLEQLEHLPWPGVTTIPTVTAQVIALNSSDFANTVDLNVGTREGVAVGMPVVGGAGLVGQVIESWSSGCTVRLITDVQSSVGVRYGDHGSLALANGRGAGQALEIDYITPGTTLSRGMVLTTAGLQRGLYPAGIPVAEITSFSSPASATQESVSARPLADLAELEYVDVLLWQPSS
jgi:rod shape-determining protein MreC